MHHAPCPMQVLQLPLGQLLGRDLRAWTSAPVNNLCAPARSRARTDSESCRQKRCPARRLVNERNLIAAAAAKAPRAHEPQAYDARACRHNSVQMATVACAMKMPGEVLARVLALVCGRSIERAKLFRRGARLRERGRPDAVVVEVARAHGWHCGGASVASAPGCSVHRAPCPLPHAGAAAALGAAACERRGCRLNERRLTLPDAQFVCGWQILWPCPLRALLGAKRSVILATKQEITALHVSKQSKQSKLALQVQVKPFLPTATPWHTAAISCSDTLPKHQLLATGILPDARLQRMPIRTALIL